MLLVAFGVLPLIVVSVAAARPSDAGERDGKRLRGRGCVDDLHKEFVLGVIARDGSVDTRGRVVERAGDHFGSEMA